MRTWKGELWSNYIKECRLDWRKIDYHPFLPNAVTYKTLYPSPLLHPSSHHFSPPFPVSSLPKSFSLRLEKLDVDALVDEWPQWISFWCCLRCFMVRMQTTDLLPKTGSWFDKNLFCACASKKQYLGRHSNETSNYRLKIPHLNM